MEHILSQEQLSDFAGHLRREERAETTVGKYLHELQLFLHWLRDRPVTRETVVEWKESLCASGRAAVTVNGSLAALHSFFTFAGWTECRVRYLKLQRQAFRDASRDLNRGDFRKLVNWAERRGDRGLALLLQTICATGIRVSEVRYITLEALRQGRAEIALKGKIRTILIPGKLRSKLLQYAQRQNITGGSLFRDADGRELSRGQIWRRMKSLCKGAGVDASKVFPHNLRHLFARTFYEASGNIVSLADVLGHSSIETTRIYLITTGEAYARQLDRLGLVV